MKKFAFFMLLVSGALTLNAQDNDKEPYMTKSLGSEAVNKIHVETSGGSITVAGGASDARIEVYVRGNNNSRLTKEEIQKRLEEDYSLEVNVSGGELTAIAKQKNRMLNWKKSLSIAFRVYVGNKVDSKLSTSGGSIAISNLTGTQRFSTSGGSLNVQKLSGNIDGSTSGGSITLEDSNGDIDLSTSGGSITSSHSEGNLKLHTSGGSLRFADLKGKIESSTSGGSITGNNIAGELIAHTSGGSINLKDLSCSLETSTSGRGIPVDIKELGKDTRSENSGGNIALQMPGDKGVNLDLRGNRISADKLSNFNGSKDDDSINGTINGGGVPVSVRAGSGKIALSLK